MPNAATLLKTCTLTIAAACLNACVSNAGLARPDAYYSTVAETATPASLFSGDAAVLSDDDIARILAYRYETPAQVRIALLPLHGQGVAWAGEAVGENDGTDPFVTRLRAAPTVFDASYLPTILTPERLSVPYLREAAARFQADLLLVFRSECRGFSRYRLFADDQAREYCAVEAVVLDTRTGLVPFTSVARRRYDVARESEDYSLGEARFRAEASAVGAALVQIADELIVFLGPER